MDDLDAYNDTNIELLKIHSNLCPISNQRKRSFLRETFSKNFFSSGPKFLSSTSTKLGAHFLREGKKHASWYLPQSLVLTFEWSSNRVLGQRTRVSSVPRNSFIEEKVYSPPPVDVSNEEKRKRKNGRGGAQAGYRKLLLFYQPRSQRRKPEVMALRSPSGIETAAA